MSIYINIYVHMFIFIYINTYVYVCIYIYIYTCTYKYINLYMYIFIQGWVSGGRAGPRMTETTGTIRATWIGPGEV